MKTSTAAQEPRTDEEDGPYPSLRGDLRIARIGVDKFLVTEPRSRTRFEANRREKFLLDQLDGRRAEDEILERYEERFGTNLPLRSLREFVEQLRVHGLLAGSEENLPREDRSDSVSASDAPLHAVDEGSFLNTFFDVLVLLFGFLVHPAMLAPVGLAAGIATVGLVRNWQSAYDQWHQLFLTVDVPIFFFVLAVKLLFLDIPKSLLLGMGCRRFGGRAKALRFELFRGLLPIVQCDIGDSLLTISDRGRRTLLALRLSAQVGLASLAILAWLMTFRFSALSHFFLILAVAGVFSLLFQLNVLMPLDGYFVLAYYFDTPRLRDRAREETRAWLTFRRSPEPLTRRERFWFRLYGLSTYVWSALLAVAVVGFGMWILVERFGRGGALLGVAVVLRWFQHDVVTWLMSVKFFRRLVRAGGKWYVRWPVRALAVIALFVVANLPYAHEISGECRVVPAEQYGARAQVAAEIVGIHVKEGDLVERGALLATLTDRDVGTDVTRTAAQIEEARANYDLLLNGPLPEEIAVVEREVERLRIELDFHETEVGRFRELVESEIRSQGDLDQQIRLRDAAQKSLEAETQRLARVQIGAREEQKAAAKAAIDRLQAELDFHLKQQTLLELRTPIAGRVVTPFMQERLGQVAQEGELICVVESADLLIEVEADEAAVTSVAEGMEADVRLWGLDGIPLHGEVVRLAHSAWTERDMHRYGVRSDRELLLQSPEDRTESKGFRVYVKLDEAHPVLVSGMTGYSKIRIETETVWRAVRRPVVRFFRTEVWSWLP